MKLILPFLFFFNLSWALDYDPKFHERHRYNNHEAPEETTTKEKSQKMEASETSPEPLKTTPNVRMIEHEEKK